jgi:hypothetical protein
MADAIVQLNPGPSSGGLPFATVQDGALTNHQKVVLELETAGLPGAVTTANPLPVVQTAPAVVGGTLASGGATAGINPVKVGGEYNSTPVTVTTGQQYALQLDANGYLKVNTAAGAAAGGTSSTYGAALPATGTAIGAKSASGSLMQALQVDASGYLQVNVSAGATQAVVDNSTGWTSGTSQGLPFAGFYATSPTALTTGDFGIPLMAKTRQLRTVLDIDAAANSAASIYGLVAPATPVATAIKTSVGAVGMITASNDTSAPVYLKFWNLATGSVTLGTTACAFQIEIPGNISGTGGGFTLSLPVPIPFSTAITYAVTGLISFTDNTAITASKVNLTVLYA